MEVNFWRFDWFSTDTLIGLFLCHVTIVRADKKRDYNLDQSGIRIEQT